LIPDLINRHSAHDTCVQFNAIEDYYESRVYNDYRKAPEGGVWAICPEVPGANGQGETIEEAKNNLREAIELILEDRKADIIRGLPYDAIQAEKLVLICQR